MKICLMLLLLFLGACARPPQPQWAELPSAETLLTLVNAQSGRYYSLDAEAAVSVTSEGRHFSSRQFLLVEQPDRLRVDALSGFGQLLMQLASDGDQLTVLLNTTVPPRFFSGGATEENFSRFVRLPLSASLLVPMMLYSPPVVDYRESGVVVLEGRPALVLHGDVLRQTFVFDHELRLTDGIYEQNDRTILTAAYSRFSPRDNFPRRIELEMPQQEVSLALRIDNLQTNAEIPRTRFRLQAPTGVEIEELP